MIQVTGDEQVVYGVATARDYEGNLGNIEIGMSLEQAQHIYDNFQSIALLKVTVEVLSSIDGVIQPREEP